MEYLQKSSERNHNYQKSLENVISKIKKSGERPSLCLHACCGPCSSYVLEYLAKYFDVTVLYYNPNIYPAAEYERRLSELQTLYTHFPPVLENRVKVVVLPYDPEEYYSAINVRNEPYIAEEPEKGERCHRCYELRLKCTYNYAKTNGFDYFCTTLSISPFKDAEQINSIGMELAGTTEYRSLKGNAIELPPAKDGDPAWLISDFKKNGGFRRSLELSEEYNLFRQEYCGCVYSKESKTPKNV